MFSHVSPYVCSNIKEFEDERSVLTEVTFPKLSAELAKLNVNFEACMVDWSEGQECAKSGHLLRLLLQQIRKSKPFFICLLGQQYGTYLEENQQNKSKGFNWIEKNLMIASQTGFNYLVNQFNYHNSFLEYQINLALSDESNHSYCRFYYRQSEYLENKFESLPIDERKLAFESYDAENDYCHMKIKELKLRIAKKGIIVKYYKSLDQLHELVYEDLIEMILEFLRVNYNPNKSRHELQIESEIYNKMKNYYLTDSIQYLLQKLDLFCRQETTELHGGEAVEEASINREDKIQTDEFVEILKLRHPKPSNEKSSSARSAAQMIRTDTTPLYLFYFLKPKDYILTIIVDIICKMRQKYTNKESSSLLNNELNNTNSIVEQFHASLLLGPSIIFIDGLSEMEEQQLKLSSWLPPNMHADVKFVLTLRKSSEFYSELSNYSTCVANELHVFDSDQDFHCIVSRQMELQNNSYNSDPNNILYAKFLSFYALLKSSNHASNPLFMQLIAKELFCFDADIYATHPLYAVVSKLKTPLLAARSFQARVNTAVTQPPANIIESYVENVYTLRELVQMIILRYLPKDNWSIKTTMPLSKENPGWVGETLCLIALSVHGLTKSSILSILRRRGYTNNFEINELNWCVFRVQYNCLINEELNGVLRFSHDYFKEAIQALLLDGMNIMGDLPQSDFNLPPCKQNISEIQKDLHIAILIEHLNQLKKEEFDECCQIDNRVEHNNNIDLPYKCLTSLHEIIYHLYMIYDLVNLCKFLTNFKVLQLFYENRMNYLNEWFDVCKFIKLSSNMSVLRVILLSSFTIGLPQYEIIIKEDTLLFKQNTSTDEKSECSESQLITTTNKVDSIIEATNFHRIFNNLQTQSTGSLMSKSTRTSLEVANEFYESHVDKLLDLQEIVDLTRAEHGDSINLILINRALVLVDLMKNLEDLYFQENFAFKLCKHIDNVVTQNYPLNGTEKLKYSYLLEELANISIQLNDYEAALRFFIKCIELLDDLFNAFHLSDMNPKFKTKIQLLQINSRLSILHSNMALLLLKMNTLSAANAVLSKANRFEVDLLNKKFAHLDLEFKTIKSVLKHDIQLQVKNDNNQLLYKDNVEKKLANVFKKSMHYKLDDGAVLEAKFSYFFISALYEVQTMHFENANTYFEQALSLSIQWFGAQHLNTSKIYHYYGCFYSLQNMKFSNQRRAELYLRKALYIKEKHKDSPNALHKLKNNFLTPTNASLVTPRENYLFTERSHDLTISDNQTSSSTALKPEKLFRNEEQNSISEILFDLGCLLTSYDSIISKKEALDYLRRSLDIKVLLLGPNHPDCLIINKKLNEFMYQTASSPQNLFQNSRVSSGVSPKSRLDKYVKELKQHAEPSRANSSSLDKWLQKNSIIEKIPSKQDRQLNAEKLRRHIVLNDATENRYAFDEQFMKSFDYSINRDSSMCLETATSSSRSNVNHKQNGSTPNLNVNKKPDTTQLNRIHLKHCKCPTAISIDTHNTMTINGPHSCVRHLLNANLLSSSDKIKINYKPPNVQTKILKHIYYKSVWYDLPPGSSMRRYKSFVKVSSNA